MPGWLWTLLIIGVSVMVLAGAVALLVARRRREKDYERGIKMVPLPIRQYSIKPDRPTHSFSGGFAKGGVCYVTLGLSTKAKG